MYVGIKNNQNHPNNENWADIYRTLKEAKEDLFDYLKAPVKRVAAKDLPIPFSPSLEDYVLPKVSDVVEAVRSIVYR